MFEDREYVIATDNSPPFQVIREDGSVGGAAVETIERAASRLGIRLRWKHVLKGPDAAFATDPEVDLWPFVMDLPERRKSFYIAEPYVTASYVLVSTTPLQDLNWDELRGKRIAIRNMEHFRNLFQQTLPDSTPQTIDDIDQILIATCRGEVFGGITVMDHLSRFLLKSRSACPDTPIYIRGIPGWKVDLSVGSTFQNASLADALRTEMGALAREHALDDLFTQYQPLAAMSSAVTFSTFTPGPSSTS